MDEKPRWLNRVLDGVFRGAMLALDALEYPGRIRRLRGYRSRG